LKSLPEKCRSRVRRNGIWITCSQLFFWIRLNFSFI